MRTKDILTRYPTARESVVAFVDMDVNTVGKVLPRLERATGSDVVYNGKRVQVFLLIDRLRKDADFQLEVWRRIDKACSLSEDARKLGLTLDQVILLHLLQAVDRGHAIATGPNTFTDSIDRWRTQAGRHTWTETAAELSAIWENSGGPNCIDSKHQSD